MPADNPYVLIGKITRPHGIRGELCVQYYAESFDYLKNSQILLQAGKMPPKPCIVKSFKEQGSLLIVKLQGIDTRNQAELLRNYQIVIEEKLLSHEDIEAINAEEEFSPYLHHLIGCTAFYLVDNEEKELGNIKEISFPTNQEIWHIYQNDTEILFPAISEFIAYYDLEHKKVVLTPPEGLIDIYLEEN